MKYKAPIRQTHTKDEVRISSSLRAGGAGIFLNLRQEAKVTTAAMSAQYGDIFKVLP
jgi:hypothetical protein